MKRSSERILTTITGSLMRPPDLVDMMREKENNRPYERELFTRRARQAIIDAVHKECEAGIDVPSDGEQSKSGFVSYQAERLAGFEEDPNPPKTPDFRGSTAREWAAFPEYYEEYMKRAMFGALLAPNKPMQCTGPVKYIGHAALKQDLDDFKAGLAGQTYAEAFVPSTNPLGMFNRRNEYYRTQEEYQQACIDALRQEHQAIIDAGFLLQIDDPGIAMVDSGLDPAERRKRLDERVEQINYMLRGLPEDRIRFHTCHGTWNQGPSIFNLQLRDFVEPMLQINAQAFLFETMNPRHMHDYHAFEDVNLPDGKIIIPGMLSHGANWVEHPELIAEFTCNYARLVGRENVMIGSDCGFASQAGTKEVDTRVMWAKLKALSEGAALATNTLWSRSAARV
jgi:5-methyltetrahydropteroyltriglutamate--homocysteine methyltransferase